MTLHAPRPSKPRRATFNRLYVDNKATIEEAEQWLQEGEDQSKYEDLMSVRHDFSGSITLKELLEACEQLPAYPDSPEDIIIYIEDSDQYTKATLQIWTDLPDETEEEFNKRLKLYEQELVQWEIDEKKYKEERKTLRVKELEAKIKKLKK